MIRILPTYESTVTTDLSMDTLKKNLADITVKNYFSKGWENARFVGKVEETTFRISIRVPTGTRQSRPIINGIMKESNGKTTVTLQYGMETGAKIFTSFVLFALLYTTIANGEILILLFGLMASCILHYPIIYFSHRHGVKISKEIIERIIQGTSVW